MLDPVAPSAIAEALFFEAMEYLLEVRQYVAQLECAAHQDLNAALASMCMPAIWLYIAGDVPAAMQTSFLRAAVTVFGFSFSCADMCAAIASNACGLSMR